MNGGALCWGIKRSFREYVGAIEDGSVSTAEDAREQDGEIWFPHDGSDQPLYFSGSVTLSAYGGMMEVTLADPRITLRDTAWALSVREPGDARPDHARVGVCDLVFLERADAGRTVAFRAKLAASGVRLFDGVYPAGTPMDDVRVRADDVRTLVAAVPGP